MGDIGQPHPQVTIGTLPDDVLLQIFKFFVDAMCSHHFSASGEWHTLIHVCRRWRDLTFTSPRHLNLQLRYSPPHRSVEEMLDIWPELPIYIDIDGAPEETIDHFAAALKLDHRVSGIHLENIRDSELMGDDFVPDAASISFSDLFADPPEEFDRECNYPIFLGRICAVCTRPSFGWRFISGITATTFVCHQPCPPFLWQNSTTRIHFSSRNGRWPLSAQR